MSLQFVDVIGIQGLAQENINFKTKGLLSEIPRQNTGIKSHFGVTNLLDLYRKEIDLKRFCRACISMVKGDPVERYFMAFLSIRAIMVIDTAY